MMEVIVAMTILGAGILGVMGTFTLSMRAASQSIRLDEAARLAENELSQAVLLPRDALQASSGRSEQYRWSVEFADRPHGLMLATVKVTWSVRGQPQEFRLSRVFLPRS